MADITIIGNAAVDLIAQPVNERVFYTGSLPVENIKLSFGGDALNEAVILSRYGKRVELISKIGKDEAGERIISHLESAGVLTEKLLVDSVTPTSINVVLVDEAGERHFLTNPKSGQRKLSESDVRKSLKSTGSIVSFASMFVSPLLDIASMTNLFRTIKEEFKAVLVADLTKAKNGERLEDLKELLPYIDYIVPNEEEISMLTGNKDPYANIELLFKAGVSRPIIKCGNKGCILRTKDRIYHIPAYAVERCIDTTGAGDSFAAGLIWALSEGWSPFDSGCFACAVSSFAVEEIGAADGVKPLKEALKRYEEVKKAALRINKKVD